MEETDIYHFVTTRGRGSVSKYHISRLGGGGVK